MAVARGGGAWRVARGGVMRLKPRPAAPPAPGKHPPPYAARRQARKLLVRGMAAPLQGIAAGYRVRHGR